jgi:hypothetical protein
MSIKWLYAALNSFDTPAANGGRPTASEAVSGVKNVLFPDVSSAERAAGVSRARKVFIAHQADDNGALVSPRISLEGPSEGDDYYLISPGTLTDTEDTRSGRPYGYGTLASGASAGATSITVTVEHADYASLSPNPFQVGDLVRVDARATIEDSGLSEYRTVASVSYAGATLTLGIDALENDYAAGAHVASVIEPGDTAPSAGSVTETGGVTYGGTIAVTSAGAILQTWTITVTDATTGALQVDGDTLGSGVATGAQGADLAPLNPDTNAPYFSLPADGWGGTAADGDSISFTTTPAQIGLWYDHHVPAGAGTLASSSARVCLEAEASGD